MLNDRVISLNSEMGQNLWNTSEAIAHVYPGMNQLSLKVAKIQCNISSLICHPQIIRFQVLTKTRGVLDIKDNKRIKMQLQVIVLENFKRGQRFLFLIAL